MSVYLVDRYIGTLVGVRWHGGDTPWEIDVLDDAGQAVRLEAKSFKVEASERLTIVEGRCCQVKE